MNIFVTSRNAIEAAQALDDKRLNKMCLESCQLLSNVMHLRGLEGPYKLTHKNHPCTKWANESVANYQWLVVHFRALCNEWKYRFKKSHACSEHLDKFVNASFATENDLMTPFVNCTKFEDKDVVVAYRKCLNEKWENDKIDPVWTLRAAPLWVATRFQSKDHREVQVKEAIVWYLVHNQTKLQRILSPHKVTLEKLLKEEDVVFRDDIYKEYYLHLKEEISVDLANNLPITPEEIAMVMEEFNVREFIGS